MLDVRCHAKNKEGGLWDCCMGDDARFFGRTEPEEDRKLACAARKWTGAFAFVLLVSGTPPAAPTPVKEPTLLESALRRFLLAGVARWLPASVARSIAEKKMAKGLEPEGWAVEKGRRGTRHWTGGGQQRGKKALALGLSRSFLTVSTGHGSGSGTGQRPGNRTRCWTREPFERRDLMALPSPALQ
ncbi:hypothetical protein Ct61P_06262 [Colletotrichum tofieldiae]|nr:hypothetical protein Ct61P_06262 [Colletotrichum tofieldiae]